MNLMSNELFKAVRYALYAGATAVVGFSAAPVFAQDAQDQGGQQLETVTVTGSRIRKADVETAQPIVVIDRAAIEKQGFNSVADILQNMTEAGSPPISRSSVLASGEAVGGYYIDLRNLGANRTLVLVNGKRLGASTDGLQDLSQIPIAAVERLEILKDGASAIYGSDAIAGVVNVITRKNYDGAQFDAYVGQFDQDDGAAQTYSMTLGTHTDRGSITMAAEYSKSDPVFAKNRDWSRYPQGPNHPTTGWTSVSQWGQFFMPAGFCGNGAGRACSLNPGGDPFNPADYHVSGSGGPTADKSNANEEMMVQTSVERHSLFVTGEYSITDHIKFSTDLLYNKRSTIAQVAGYPFQPANQIPGAATPYIGLSGESYYNPTGSHHTNPDGTITTENGGLVYFYRRGWEVPRTTQSDLQTYRVSGTLSGDFQIGDHSWNWDVGGYVNTNDLLQTSHGDFNTYAASQALGPSFYDPNTGHVTCGTPDQALPWGTAPGNCIPWNPIVPAGQVGYGGLSGNPDLQSFLFPYYHATGRTKEVDYSANVSGSVFALPAGDLAIAAGYEHRNNSGSFYPDALQIANLSTSLPGGPTSGKYKVDEYYVEVDVPVLKDLPLAKELSFNVAGRYSKYDTFGDTTNGKFSLTWKPIDDLLVRANYAQGFRAPTISDLYGGISGTFPYYTDPCDTNFGAAATNSAVLARCTGGFAGQVPTPAGFRQPCQGGAPCDSPSSQSGVNLYAGSNPFLQPELSTSKTAGLVYSPSWIAGLDLSLDWYRIHIKNAISGDTLTGQLDDCYIRGIESRCAIFARSANTGGIIADTTGSINQGWIDTEGWDLGVNYRLPEFSFGRFAVHWNTTYVSHNNTKPTDDAQFVSPGTSFAGSFRIRSNASVDWSLGDFGATWGMRYYSSQKEKCAYDKTGGPECNIPDYTAPDVGPGLYPLNRVGALTLHDLSARWNAPWNATVSVGVNNAFDKKLPVMYSAPNSQFFTYGGWDIGRFYYLRYSQRF